MAVKWAAPSCSPRAKVSSSFMTESPLDVEPRVLEVEIALDAVHHLVVDPSLAAQLDDRLTLGVEQLAAQPLVVQGTLLDHPVVLVVEAGPEAALAELVEAEQAD